MNFDFKPQVDFLVEDTVLPFYPEIRKIYLGYRQCYKTDPTGELKIDPTKAMTLIARATAYYEYYNRSHPEDKWVQPDSENIDKYLEYWQMCSFIANHMNHESPLEHGSMSVRVTMSRSASHQWVRSRVASHSQASQRYIKTDDPDFICPPSIRHEPIAYDYFCKYLGRIPEIVETFRRLGIPNEDIRAIFPNAITTEIVTTANLREWQHILEERCCTRAQEEIRTIATKIRDYLQKEIPFIFHGSKCERLGYCPEGKGCCGKMPVRTEAVNEQK